MGAKALVVAAIVGASVLNGVLFVLVAAPLARFARVFIERAAIGSGPQLFTFEYFGAQVAVKLLPTSSYVVPVGGNPYASTEPALPPSRRPWPEAPRWRRAVAFVVAPRMVALAIAGLVLGPVRATQSTASAISQFVSGVLSPLAEGRQILSGGLDILGREGFLTLFAVGLCKVLGVSLLFLPSDGAYAIARANLDRIGTLRAIVMLASLIAYGSWVVAIVAWMV